MGHAVTSSCDVTPNRVNRLLQTKKGLFTLYEHAGMQVDRLPPGSGRRQGWDKANKGQYRYLTLPLLP